MRSQFLILGMALGCSGLVVVALANRQRPTKAAESIPAPVPRGSEAGTELVTELREAPAPSVVAPVQEQAPERIPAAEAAVSSSPGVAVSADLLDEIQRACASGSLNDRRLAEFLAAIQLENGRAREALELLQRFGSRNANLFTNVAGVFKSRGDEKGMREALLAALALAPRDDRALGMLNELDPGLAIQRLSQLLAAEPPPGQVALRMRLVRALMEGGRASEASALVDGLLAQAPEDEQAIGLLAQLDLGRAIAYVEQRMTESSEPAELRGVLVDLFARSGDVGRAEALLEHDARAGQVISADEWGQIADLWLGSDNPARGTAALERALAVEHSDPDQWVHALADLAPADLLLALERRVATDEARNDEYWGSLADSYWAAGRRGEAQAAWEKARALDPGDSEWPGRLRALELGRDPYDD